MTGYSINKVFLMNRHYHSLKIILIAIFFVTITGCGQTGPLYLPSTPGPAQQG
jgi:predicted small lipoprotein YifL